MLPEVLLFEIKGHAKLRHSVPTKLDQLSQAVFSGNHAQVYLDTRYGMCKYDTKSFPPVASLAGLQLG
jgi:hypothetical protein